MELRAKPEWMNEVINIPSISNCPFAHHEKSRKILNFAVAIKIKKKLQSSPTFWGKNVVGLWETAADQFCVTTSYQLFWT